MTDQPLVGTHDGPTLVDSFGRAITYVRVSVTDRCDFRCAYCMMAANAMQGSDEQSRLEHAAAGYRAVLMGMEARSLSAA